MKKYNLSPISMCWGRYFILQCKPHIRRLVPDCKSPLLLQVSFHALLESGTHFPILAFLKITIFKKVNARESPSSVAFIRVHFIFFIFSSIHPLYPGFSLSFNLCKLLRACGTPILVKCLKEINIKNLQSNCFTVTCQWTAPTYKYGK